MMAISGSTSAVRRGLQPRPLVAGALFPGGDLGGMLEGEPDIVEAFEQAHAVGRRDLEGEIGAAGTADALRLRDRP